MGFQQSQSGCPSTRALTILHQEAQMGLQAAVRITLAIPWNCPLCQPNYVI